MRRRTLTRTRIRAGCRTGVGALAAGLLVLGGGSAAARTPSPTPITPASSSNVQYAVGEHACAAPTSRSWSCFAVRFTRVARGTVGARPYVVPSAGGHGPAGGFSPADLAKVYGYSPSGASNQTVAIIDAFDDPNALHDLKVFDAHYGLPAETSTSFRKVNGNGAAHPLPSPDAGWGEEISLDVQTVRAVCNKCKIILVEVANPDPVSFAAAVRTAAALHATEISNSYGGPEDPSNPLPANVRSAYDQPGIVVTGSTGDDGWYDWDFANDGNQGWGDNAPNTPSAYPSVVAVGGTTLKVKTDGTRNTETVWNSNGASDQNGLQPGPLWLGRRLASGGGCSVLYPALPFQASVPGYANTGCGTKRLAGDVAADADPSTGFDVYDTYGDPGWGRFGGTSLSAPLIAAMWALGGGAGGVRYPSQDLYDRSENSPSVTYDVTTGGNGFCGGDTVSDCQSAVGADTVGTNSPNDIINHNPVLSGGWAGDLDCSFGHHSTTTRTDNTQCNAAAGYDGPSGVGTPTGLLAFKSMVPRAGIKAPALKLKSPAQFRAVNISDAFPGATINSYSWNWRDGTTSTTPNQTVSHTYSKKGTYLVTLTITDDQNRSGFNRALVTVGMPLAPAVAGPATVHVNQAVTFSSAASRDPNTGGVLEHWTWRSGPAVTNLKVVGTTATLHLRFRYLGEHVLRLAVADNQGLMATKTVSVDVVR